VDSTKAVDQSTGAGTVAEMIVACAEITRPIKAATIRDDLRRFRII